jgi:hypothetical protein
MTPVRELWSATSRFEVIIASTWGGCKKKHFSYDLKSNEKMFEYDLLKVKNRRMLRLPNSLGMLPVSSFFSVKKICSTKFSEKQQNGDAMLKNWIHAFPRDNTASTPITYGNPSIQ